jgi:hypothetical protein
MAARMPDHSGIVLNPISLTRDFYSKEKKPKRHTPELVQSSRSEQIEFVFTGHFQAKDGSRPSPSSP